MGNTTHASLFKRENQIDTLPNSFLCKKHFSSSFYPAPSHPIDCGIPDCWPEGCKFPPKISRSLLLYQVTFLPPKFHSLSPKSDIKLFFNTSIINEMDGFEFNPNFEFDAMNASFGPDPNLGEQPASTNQGATSQSGGIAGDTSELVPVHDNDPFVDPEALMPNGNFNPFLPIADDNNPFMAQGDLQTEGPESEHGQAMATNAFNVEEDDWLQLTNEEQDEAFNRLMEMSPEEFEKMMKELPDEDITTSSPSSTTTQYATGSKRVRRSEEDSALASVGVAPLMPPPQENQQIRHIREAKSRPGKVIEGLEKKVQDLEAELAKAHLEAKGAFEDGRMVALLGAEGDWEAKEAKLRTDADLEHERQTAEVRQFFERQIAEQRKQLAEYRAEAEEYQKRVLNEAEGYKKAAEEEIVGQRAASKAAEEAKDRAESSLLEQRRVLESAKPYVAGLEKKIADLEGEKVNWEEAERQREQAPKPPPMSTLEARIEELEADAERAMTTVRESETEIERLNGAKELAEAARVDRKKAFESSQSYASELELKLEKLEKEQSSMEAARLEQEEKCEALENMVKYFESITEKAERTKKESQSIVGPVEQVNVEPSTPTNAKALSEASSFTFVATKKFPSSQVEVEPIQGKRSRRQSRRQRQPQSQSQPQSQLDLEPKSVPEPTPPSQWGMFSHHSHTLVPAIRPRRIHIHAEEAIRNRFQIPLDKVHRITAKLDKLDKTDSEQDVAGVAGLLIAAELTGLSISDLKVMRSLRMGFPSSSVNPKSVMTSAQLEIPKSLVDLLASENRPAIRAFLDGASFPQSQASSNIAGDVRSQGSQIEALDVEAQEIEESQWIQKEAAVVAARLKQSRRGIGLGVASPWKRLIFLCVLAIILPLLLQLLWASSPVAWLSKDPAHG